MGDVGSGGEQPERREVEGGDRGELDGIPCGLAYGEALCVRLVLTGRARRYLDPADELDRDAQEVLRGRLVQPRAAHETRQHELGRLVDAAAGEREDRANRALRQRQEECDAAGHS